MIRPFALAGSTALLLACAEVPALPPAPPMPLPPTAAVPLVVASETPTPEASVADGGRPRAVLVVEIQSLESLFAQAARASPDRPALARRLAEGYVELESTAEGERLRLEAARSPKNEGAVEKATVISRAARRAAIKYYSLLTQEYPSFCLHPSASDPRESTGCDDEVLFYLSYEQTRDHRPDEARQADLALIKRWPDSRFLPSVYVAFGDQFFDEGATDPAKLALAASAYEKATQTPPPGNKVWGYAHYKLGFLRWNSGDPARALSELVKTIEYGTQYAGSPNADKLAQVARHDILPIYASVGDPRKAFEFVRPLSGDVAPGLEHTFAMLRELGQQYLDTGHFAEAAVLALDHLRRVQGEGACAPLAQLDQALAALRSSGPEPPAVRAALAADGQAVSRARERCPRG